MRRDQVRHRKSANQLHQYRLYIYDVEDRLIASAMVITADNDKAAIEQSENMLDAPDTPMNKEWCSRRTAGW
jgi:hypothetical protein